MSTWAVVLLGVIAAASLVQAAFLVGLAIEGRRLARRLDALQTRLDREIGPALDHFVRVSRNLAEISDLATLQARRIDLVLADVVDKIEETTSAVQRLIVRPLAPLANLVALLTGLRKGLEVYWAGREPERHERSSRRRRHTEDDEHLFI
jgi:hypothetical protein